MMARSLILCLVLIVGVTSAWSAPVEIESDHLEIEQIKHEALFTGKVHLIRGDFELFCDELLVHYNDKQGNGIKQADAAGHVRMKQGDKRGSSNTAVLDNEHHILTLIGDAEMEQADGRVRGHTIIHNMKTNKTVVQRGEHSRVSLHMNDKDTKKTPDKAGNL